MNRLHLLKMAANYQASYGRVAGISHRSLYQPFFNQQLLCQHPYRSFAKKQAGKKDVKKDKAKE